MNRFLPAVKYRTRFVFSHLFRAAAQSECEKTNLVRYFTPILLGLVTAACNRTEAASPTSSAPGVRVEVVSKKRMDSLDGELFVRFKVKNETAKAISYQGWSEDLPASAVEVQEGGVWTQHMIGWSGTGMLDFTIRPGAEMEFDLKLPEDKRTYRAKFGDPPVVTPPVVATAP